MAAASQRYLNFGNKKENNESNNFKRTGRMQNNEGVDIMPKLTDTQIKILAELALIRAIPDQELDEEWRESHDLKPLKPGRLRGLFERLVKVVDKEMGTIPQPLEADINKVNGLIREFGRASGWEYKQYPVVVNISFCAGIFENSTSKIAPKIIHLINEIIDYFDRKEPVPLRYFRGGLFAAEKWNELFL